MLLFIFLLLLSGFARPKDFREQNNDCFSSLQQDHILNGSIITLCAEEIELRTKLNFIDLEYLALTGHPNQTIINCSNFSGFEISGSQNIQISNIVLVNCGALHSFSTTESIDKAVKIPDLASSVHVSNTTQIEIQNVRIISSYGKGLSMFNSYGHVIDCQFQDNKIVNEEQGHVNSVYGGGMYIELNSNNSLQYSNKHLTIKNCNFSHNEISFPHRTSRVETYISCSSKNEYRGFIRGGGLAIYLRGQVEGATISLENVDIRKNKATWGGGMYVHFCNQAHRNKVSISSVTFTENSCEDFGGGGVDIGFTYDEKITDQEGATAVIQNELIFQDCIFERNRALFGGGVAFYIAPSDYEHNDSVSFINCSWLENSANYGAAIDLAPQQVQPSLHVHMPKITFKDVNFENNVIAETSRNNT